MNEYILLGYANYDCKDKDNYEMSLKHFGYKYQIVGQGEKWLNFIDNKIKRPLEYLKRNRKKYKVTIFTDVFDVLACDYPRVLLDRFYRVTRGGRKRICIGMENLCFGPICTPLNVPEIQNQRMKYANSGFYIGYTEDIIEMWETLITYGHKDDQKCICRYINDNPDKFHLDVDSSFIANIHMFSKNFFRWQDNAITRIDTQKKPCFVHFPGTTSLLGWYNDDYGKLIFGDEYNKRTFDEKLKGMEKIMIRHDLWVFIGILILVILVIIICIQLRKR